MESITTYEHQGVTFYDIAPVLQNHLKKVTQNLWWQVYQSCDFDLIVGLESRGFIIGAAISAISGKGFVMARKPGKLPGEVTSVKYKKEYGEDELCVQSGALKGKRILIVDDILATGGSLKAAMDLMDKSEAKVVGFACLLGLKEFEDKWPTNIPLYVLDKR